MSENNQYSPTLVTHPGLTLKDFMEEKRISIALLAKTTNIPAREIEEITDGSALYDCDMAEQFAIVFGLPVSFWMDRLEKYKISTIITTEGGE